MIVTLHGQRAACRRWRRRSAAGNPAAAQIVAAECVVLAETKDHLDWELLGEVAKELSGRGAGSSSRRPTNASRTRKTSTSITRKAGAVSCGWNRWVSMPSCRLPKRSAM